MSATAMALALAVVLGSSAPTPVPAAILVGPLGTWATSIKTHAPAPTGAPISVELVPGLKIEGVEAGGGWDGEKIQLEGRDTIAIEHELGHAYDDRDLTDHWRGVLENDMHVSGPWSNPDRWGGDLYCKHITCPNELFADARAGCALNLHLSRPYSGARPRRHQVVRMWWSGYGLRISPASYQHFCADLRASAVA